MLQELGRIEDETFRQRKKTHDIIKQRRESRDKQRQGQRAEQERKQRQEQEMYFQQTGKRKSRDFDLSKISYIFLFFIIPMTPFFFATEGHNYVEPSKLRPGWQKGRTNLPI